jgi:hypothetical protein
VRLFGGEYGVSPHDADASRAGPREGSVRAKISV